MLQNIKNFLIAFLAGLIVFGACAILVLYIIRSGSKAPDNTNITTSTQSVDYTVEDSYNNSLFSL